MGTVNLGNQTVSVKFRHPVTSTIVNAQNNFVVEPGIYRGGYPSTSGANLVISPFVVVIRDDLGSDACARIRTTQDISISWTSFGYTPGNFIVLRWPYEANVNACYLEVHNVAASALKATDIIVAKYNSYSSFDFSRRSSFGVINSFLRVVPTFPSASRNVVIKPGVIWTGSSSRQYTETILPISSTTQDTYVYIDPASNWNIATTNNPAVLAGKIPLAQILATTSNISEQFIIDMRSQINLLTGVDNTTIGYNSNQQLQVLDNSINQNKILLDHNSYLRIKNSQNTATDVIGLQNNNIRTGGELYIGKTDSANGGGRIRNVSDPVDDLDAVNLRTLRDRAEPLAVRIEPWRTDDWYDWYISQIYAGEVNNLLNQLYPNAPIGKIAFVVSPIRNYVGVGNGVATPTIRCMNPYKKMPSGVWEAIGEGSWGDTRYRDGTQTAFVAWYRQPYPSTLK